MNDATTATWHIAPDPDTDEPTLWRGDRSLIRRSDLRRVAPIAEADELFDVLTRVLAPDEATIERLTEALLDLSGYEIYASEQMRRAAREEIRALLAALAGTAAQDAEVSTHG